MDIDIRIKLNNKKFYEEVNGQRHLMMFKINAHGNVEVVNLGVVDSKGCLPSYWGDYPRVSDIKSQRGYEVIAEKCLPNNGDVTHQQVAYGATMEEAIENWNDRYWDF